MVSLKQKEITVKNNISNCKFHYLIRHWSRGNNCSGGCVCTCCLPVSQQTLNDLLQQHAVLLKVLRCHGDANFKRGTHLLKARKTQGWFLVLCCCHECNVFHSQWWDGPRWVDSAPLWFGDRLSEVSPCSVLTQINHDYNWFSYTGEHNAVTVSEVLAMITLSISQLWTPADKFRTTSMKL